MKNKILIAVLAGSLSNHVFAMGEDDPIVTRLMIDQFEKRYMDDEKPVVFEGDISIGKDLNKFKLKFDIEQVDGETHERELQALYSRAVHPYWDFQVGVRQDQKTDPKREWLVLGFEGVAPYWFEMDTALFINEDDQVNLRVNAEYEWMITQKWVLSPEIEANFYSKNDQVEGIGSGLSDSQIGLRLRYEIKREFAPYIGINWTKKYGDTADYAEADGEDTSDTHFVAGIRAWF
ncbi:MAG: copper resistance protein B [Gammaproteobacteria bacterium]